MRAFPRPGTLALLLCLVLPFAPPSARAAQERWFSPAQVARGATLFRDHCARCHGADAQGLNSTWREAGADGKYPPPPLDGSAHAWHHPLPLLRRAVREGGVPLGGSMPPFGHQLAADEIDAAIAYFQSKWPEATYAAWVRRNGVPPQVRNDEVPDIRALLTRHLPGTPLGEPQATPVPGLFGLRAGSAYLYLAEGGRYLFTGELIDLERGVDLTASRRAAGRVERLATVPPGQPLTYSATGVERTVMTVFSDVTCPYCRRLHAELPALRAAGVTVRYLPFPRDGLDGEGARRMRAVWCADDREGAWESALDGGAGEVGRGDCTGAAAVEAGYRLGRELGVRATPTIVTREGELISGFRPAGEWLRRLGMNDQRQ